MGSPVALGKVGLLCGVSWGPRQLLSSCWVVQRLKPHTQLSTQTGS